MNQANVRIDIASELHNKGFKDAEKATSSLDKAVTKLGHKLTTAFSAYKILQFGKDSVKAFAADQKAAAVLAKTLENVNQGYQTDIVNSYIAKTEALYGVLDEKLRPAFAQLVVATGDATKSQALLQTALDVSAGTGKDLQEVTAALSKAYLGNTTALMRLGVGLSKAQLQGKSFNDIITALNLNFTGQAANAANTYQGKLDRLNVAFDNMKETIGQGLMQSFEQLDSSKGFNGVIESMGKFANYISDVVVGLGVVISKLKDLPGVGLLTKLANQSGFLGILARMGSKAKVQAAMPSGVTNFLAYEKQAAGVLEKQRNIQRQQLTTAKALTKEQKDQLALKNASLLLDQQNQIFNLDKIEIAAAMMNKQTAEDMARLTLKKDLIALQEAVNAGDAKAATDLAAVVQKDTERVQAYQALNLAASVQAGLINSIKTVTAAMPTNMSLINLDNLQTALNLINQMASKLMSTTPTPTGGTTSTTGTTLAAAVAASPFAGANYTTNTSDLTGIALASALPRVDTSTLAGIARASAQPVVNVTITENAKGIVDVVMDTTQQQSASGIPTQITRNAKNLAW